MELAFSLCTLLFPVLAGLLGAAMIRGFEVKLSYWPAYLHGASIQCGLAFLWIGTCLTLGDVADEITAAFQKVLRFYVHLLQDWHTSHMSKKMIEIVMKIFQIYSYKISTSFPYIKGSVIVKKRDMIKIHLFVRYPEYVGRLSE